MTTVFIADQAVLLPSRFASGMELSDNQADILQAVWLKRLGTKLRYLLANGSIDATTLQATTEELNRREFEPWSVADEIEDGTDDPIVQEALGLAQEAITTRLAHEGLPPPRDILGHAKALLVGRPDIMERARKRVEARYRAAVALLGAS